MKIIRNLALGSCACVLLSVAPSIAQHRALGMLDSLAKGRWTVTSQDGGPSRSICLGDPQQLVQLRHAGDSCSRYVVEDQPGNVTVQYTCKGQGYGRTSIRKETSALVQIESQGIDGGLPFQFRAEARRVGTCK